MTQHLYCWLYRCLKDVDGVTSVRERSNPFCIYFSSLLFSWFHLIQPNVAFHVENSHLICIANQMTGFYMKCIANQMTGFYMKCNIGLKWVKKQKKLERIEIKKDIQNGLILILDAASTVFEAAVRRCSTK